MFKKLCSKYFSKKDITHVLMDGGILSVPFDRLDDFYSTCVQCIKDGEEIFVVEQKSECYNYFLDIDYKDDIPMDADEILTISGTIFSKVKQFCDPEQKLIVSVSKPKKKDGKIKTGIHMNFPGMIVNQNGAIQLMYHIIHTLGNVYPDKDWFQFIDPSVYGSLDSGARGSGFRMPWSYKKSKHVECGGSGCPECQNSGKITEGVYLPIFCLYKNEQELVSQDPSIEMLHMVTLRTQAKDSECLEIPTAVDIKKPKQKKEGSFTKAQTRSEVYDNDLLAFLETFVRKFMKGQEDARVTKIYKNKNNYFVQTTSKYCENLNRSHGSNHVWFFIDGKDKTICQKCFCRCETTDERKYGFCKDFSGRKHFLTTKISDIIFNKNKK